MMHDNDTIFALATGWSKAALAILRISGNGCIDSFAPCFSRPERLRSAKNATLVYGKIPGIDEVVVSVWRDGHGYTGEEALEISCHGSAVVIQKMLTLFAEIGFRQAEPGEFTYRAFRHGRMDLTQAEAVEELVDSMSEEAQQQALRRLGGELKNELFSLREQFIAAIAVIEVQLDYAEDELDPFEFPFEALESIAESMKRLAATYTRGRMFGKGAKVVIAGHPNVGKSSLFNRFLKENRAIVSAVPGTTRDYIAEHCLIDSIPVRLFDTAGLRSADDSVEIEGIERARQMVDDADIVLYLRDCDSDPVLDDKRVIPVWSKSDLNRGEGIAISSVTGEGLDELEREIGRKLRALAGKSGESLTISSERQKDLLVSSSASIESALELYRQQVPLDITASVLREALSDLGQITGEVGSREILNKIFSGFCVGK